MKQLDNQPEKNHTVKYRTQSNSIEAWSVQRLPFQPNAWLKDLQNDLQKAIPSLQSRPEQMLQAIYATSQDGLFDAENIRACR